MSSPLLLAVLRDGAVVSFAPKELCHEAARHGLTGVLERTLHERGAPAQNELKAQTLALAARSIKVKALLLKSLDALAAVGIVPVLLKGYGLAVRLYPDPLLRAASDVDLLVERTELEKAKSAIASLGLSTQEEAGEALEHYHHHVGLSGPAGLVELHFRATSGYGASKARDALTVQSAEATLDHRRVRYLLPEDELVYLAVHAAQHLCQRLSWLYDLKLLLEKNPTIDWERVRRLGKGSGMATALFASFRALEVAFRVRPPSWVMDAWRPPRWQSQLVTTLFTEERLVSATLADQRIASFLVRTALSEGPHRIARHFVDGALRESRRWLGASS